MPRLWPRWRGLGPLEGLAVGACVGIALAGSACSRSAGTHAPGSAQARASSASALLITLDTTRADALGCYGGRPGVTPNLDALATESVLYERARTTAPITLPAHVSMMTGLAPLRSAVRDNSLNPLSPEAVTLAERARDAGLGTAAVVSAAVLDDAFGLRQGFQIYLDPVRDYKTGIDTKYFETSAEDAADQAVGVLRRIRPGKRFFLWLHLFSPHGPYQPPQRFHSLGDPYLGEVAYADEAIGRVLSELRALGRLDSTWVAVVADHGEARGEHGEDTHTIFCYDSTLRVPLLIRHPDGARAGERSTETVSVVDVYATLVDALGLGEPGDVDGSSLIGAKLPANRTVFFESQYGALHYGWSGLIGAADEKAKYIHSRPEELYVADDPAELRNRFEDDRASAMGLRARIEHWALKPRLQAQGSIDPASLERLRQLGYATALGDGTVADPLADDPRPTPAQGYPQYLEIERAREASQRQDLGEACAILRALLEANPANSAAAADLSTYLIAAGKCDEAAVVLEREVAAGSPRAEIYLNLGYCQQLAGRDEEAAANFRRAVELDPGNSTALFNLSVVLGRLGRDAERQAVEQALRQGLKR